MSDTTKQISELDLLHIKMLRENVRTMIRSAAENFDLAGHLLLDIAPQDHRGAREFFRRAEIKTFDINPKSSADYIGDICTHNQDIPSDSFDVIVCTEVLEHTLDPFAAVREIWRILKPGGVLVATTPFNFRIHGPLPDCWRFTIHGIKQLVRHFSTCEIVEYPSADERFLMPLQYGFVARK